MHSQKKCWNDVHFLKKLVCRSACKLCKHWPTHLTYNIFLAISLIVPRARRSEIALISWTVETHQSTWVLQIRIWMLIEESQLINCSLWYHNGLSGFIRRVNHLVTSRASSSAYLEIKADQFSWLFLTTNFTTNWWLWLLEWSRLRMCCNFCTEVPVIPVGITHVQLMNNSS